MNPKKLLLPVILSTAVLGSFHPKVQEIGHVIFEPEIYEKFRTKVSETIPSKKVPSEAEIKFTGQEESDYLRVSEECVGGIKDKTEDEKIDLLKGKIKTCFENAQVNDRVKFVLNEERKGFLDTLESFQRLNQDIDNFNKDLQSISDSFNDLEESTK